VGELHRVAAQLAAAEWQPRHLVEQLVAAEQEPYAIEAAQMRLVQEQLDLKLSCCWGWVVPSGVNNAWP
jgi:hypothetical protein